MNPILNRTLLLSAICSGLLLGMLGSAPLRAAETTAGASLGLVSDYRVRGVSQTQRNPAVQAGWTLSSDSGFSLKFWGSNVDFSSADGSASTSLELDLVMRYSDAFGDSESASWSVAFGQYYYPGYDELNYPELYLDLAFGDFTVELVHSDDYAATGDTAVIGILGYSFGLGEGLNLGMSYGSVSTDIRLFGDTGDPTSRDFTDSFGFYRISLSRQWRPDGVTLSLQWHDTDVDETHCPNNTCTGAWVAGISQSF
ncbi:MAG: hypothetical protein ISN29_10130 [Gammaproteobacteria bacterium AqS3]|nr:hypothetical protein [Gammaproteobacteria bacterium AqS3]